jgi:predicted MPP superfamily phosphohydrolase
MDLVDGHTILLSHRPELWDTYLTYGVDLVLSGHAHGGQVRIPFLGGVIAPDQGFWPRFSEGQIEHDGTIMIVSRGLGNSILPLRVNNRPEVVVVTYRSGEE